MKTKLLNFFEALAGKWVANNIIKPGVENHRSTLQGFLYFIPLLLAYLHSGEQIIHLLQSAGTILLNIGDGVADKDAVATGTAQLTCVVAIIKAWFTHDPETIENAGIPVAADGK